ncbi:aspartyl-tRNA amidotransferase subunit B [Betaproteobacteria bacterium]|nr:aspartyl-tRNA amidotransferase subunit B [Betaproteobacteria bacterium]GHU40794.1 aspartyl-tRNA amidotransferase subunit B [Betaproteobacteria bacterium]
MSLRSRIQDDMKTALKAKETVRLGAIRLLMSEMRRKEVDERIELDDAGIAAVIDKMIKQRKDSLSQFTAAGRMDLADRESAEIDTLNAYLPEKMSEAEIAAAIDAAIAVTGAARAADMGKLMAVLKPQLAGKADMALVSGLVKARLG